MGRCLKWITCTFTAFIVLGGSVMLGLGIWVTTQDTEYKHLAGNLYATIAYIVLSSFVFITGFLGACGILLLKKTLLKVYFAMMLLLLMSELGLAIYIYVEKDKIQDHISTNWNKTSDETRIIIQQEFKCCGLKELALEHESSSHKSCFVDNDNTNDRLQDCYTKLMDWIKENLTILATCSVVVAALQMFILGGTCRLLAEIESNDRSVKRIRVAPQNYPRHGMPQQMIPVRQAHNQLGGHEHFPVEIKPQQDESHKNPQQQHSDDFVDGKRTRSSSRKWAKVNPKYNSVLSLLEK